MIVSDESTHHVSSIQHGSIQTGIDGRSTGFFLARSDQQCILILGCLIVFRERNVEEGQCRQRFAIVAGSECRTFLAVPFYLVCLDPVIAFDLFQR